MKINFIKYVSRRNFYAAKSKLAVIYPVQSVLIHKGKDWDNVMEILKNQEIEKVIIVTTNDHNLDLLPLKNICDIIIRNDGKRDDPMTWENIINYLERKNL